MGGLMRKTYTTVAATLVLVVLGLLVPAASFAAVAPAPRYFVSNVQSTGNSTAWRGWRSQAAGPYTLHVYVTNSSWHNSYNVNVGVTAGLISAAVGFDVTSGSTTVVSGGSYSVARGYYGWAGYSDVYANYSYTVKYVQPAYNGNPAKVLGTWTGTARRFTGSERYYGYHKAYSGSGTPTAPPAESSN
jgi:hypothetical protein